MCPIAACLISETTGTTPLEETNVSTMWRLWSPRLWDQAIQSTGREIYLERRSSDERQKARRLQPHVHLAGYADGGKSASDGTVPRDWPAGQRQAGKRRRCGCGGVPARREPCRFRVLSQKPAEDAGVLLYLREHAGGAGRGHDHRLDAERGHSGGGANGPGEKMVYPGGQTVRLVQADVAGEDQVRRLRRNLARLQG